MLNGSIPCSRVACVGLSVYTERQQQPVTAAKTGNVAYLNSLCIFVDKYIIVGLKVSQKKTLKTPITFAHYSDTTMSHPVADWVAGQEICPVGKLL